MEKLKKVHIGVILILITCASSFAQDTYNFTQFYFNPALLNPSFTGADGRMAMFASFRKQWAGIEGSPTISNFSLQTAFENRVNFGFNASNDKNGLLSTSGLLFTGGYTIPISELNSIRFGISIGAAWNKVDLNALRFSTASDPVQASLLSSNFQVMGNVGMSFHTPTFHVGLAVPNIFDPAYLSSETFSVSKINPFGTIITHASNRFYFANNKNMFEPYLVYRYNQNSISQIEAAAVVHLQNLVWFGGAFKQNFGISALAGFKIKTHTAVGYSYSLKNMGVNQLSAPSHEIHIGVLLGTKVKHIHTYSFVDTQKEKKHIKTPKEIMAEKEHQRQLAAQKVLETKKKQEEEAKKVAAIKTPVKKEEVVTKKEPVKEPVKKEEVVAKKEPVKEPVKKEEVVVKNEPVKKEEIVAKTEPVKEPVKEPVAGGGPRMKQKPDPLETPILANENEKILLEEEQEKIKRLQEHAADPTAEHGLTNEELPHAERHEFVKRGSHVDEMEIGDYIIVGVFRTKENARHFSDGLVKLGFSISDFGFLTEKNLWYVYLGETDDIDMARRERDKYRKLKMFKDCWLLTVHH